MTHVTRIIPVLTMVAALAWLASKAVPPTDVAGGFNVETFARLPVVYEGRVKPYDTLARNCLVIISDRQTWRDDDGVKRPAIEWLLDVMSNAPRAREHRVFRIHNDQLLTQLGLERRPGYRFAFSEFADRMPEIERQAMHAGSMDRSERDVYDLKMLEFWQRVVVYRVLSDAHAPPELSTHAHDGVDSTMRRIEMLERFSLPHPIPPLVDGDEWKPLLRAIVENAMSRRPHPVVRPLAGLLGAWAAGNIESFNAAVADYDDALAGIESIDRNVLSFEAFFNHLAPFYRCAVLYVVALFAGCLSWLVWPVTLRRTTFWLLATTFLVHTLAIAGRVYISGYPPITNLFGTAIFIGWGCVMLGLLLEWMSPLGIGNLLSSIVGFITLIIAHFLAGDGDTLQMMQAVLDTKFWLATHVIIINFGYAATFLAGGLSGLYILRGVLTRSVDATLERTFGRMIYGVLCFALLLSFLGTVLGGLWADDSWGRFWGWDPKENGALMIVLWNVLILHARWGGMIKTRGIAVLGVFGGVITAWSWFGVNQLGVGLHSYGFTDSVTFWLLVFVGTQLMVMALGMLPRGLWRSALHHPAPPRPVAWPDPDADQ